MSNPAKNHVSLICQNCGGEFMVHRARINTAKYCSKQCYNVGQKGRKVWNANLTKEERENYQKKQVEFNNECLNCGKSVKNKFCSISCQTSYQNRLNSGKTYDEIYGDRANQVRENVSKAISKKAIETGFVKIGNMVHASMMRGKTFDEIYGEDKSREIRDKIKVTLDEFRKTPEGIKMRRETSERGAMLALTGREFSNTKKGFYKGVYFGSSLEESFLKEIYRLLGSLDNVIRNTMKVVPNGNGFRKTVPDYLIVNNHLTIGIIEVKSTHLMCRPLVFEKAVALYNYGVQNEILTGYFTQDTLKEFSKLQGNPDPRRLNSLLDQMKCELSDYAVSRKEQRSTLDGKEPNKSVKDVELGSDIPNYPHPTGMVI